MSDLICVPPEKVEQVWPFVATLVSDAVNHCGDWTLNDVRESLDRGALLWITTADGKTVDAVAVTRLIESKHGKCCHAVACGGKDDDWRERFKPIEDYAKAEGCSITRIEGRRGWARLFPDYKLAWVTLEKPL